MGLKLRPGIHLFHTHRLRGIPQDALNEFVHETKLCGAEFSMVVTGWQDLGLGSLGLGTASLFG